jgi:hypothetical protein
MRAGKFLRVAVALGVLLVSIGAAAPASAMPGADTTPSAGHFSKSEIDADRAASRGRTLSQGR